VDQKRRSYLCTPLRSSTLSQKVLPYPTPTLLYTFRLAKTRTKIDIAKLVQDEMTDTVTGDGAARSTLFDDSILIHTLSVHGA